MRNVKKSRSRGVMAGVIAAAIVSLASAAAADFTIDFPAGLACAFDLRIEGQGGHQVQRDFLDKNGNLVRSISAGTGSALTFTNLDTGATLSLKSNGAVTHITYNSDGSSTFVLNGHNVLILFPTDVPAGPTTVLYVGRLVFTVDSGGTFTLQGHSGPTTDICAALS